MRIKSNEIHTKIKESDIFVSNKFASSLYGINGRIESNINQKAEIVDIEINAISWVFLVGNISFIISFFR